MDKAAIRQQVWDQLAEGGVARFPFPPHNRIPNFDGAREAADRMTSLSWWDEVSTIKCNPDAPQRPLRERALEAGKVVVMAEPRLRSDQPFVFLDPSTIDDPSAAATIGGASEHGHPIGPETLPTIDAIVSGCVAVDTDGRRIGKGEGYSDLEFACLLELGAIERSVTVATTVHELQVFEEPVPTDAHDVPVDDIVTQTTVHHATDRPERPDGLDWTLIDAGMRAEIPLLGDLADSG